MHRFLTVFEETAANPSQMNNTDMSGMLGLILLVLLYGSGIYALYTYFRLHRTCELFPNKFMYPGNCTPDKCIDVDGFIDYIEPRLLLLGVAMIICGIAYFVYAMILKANLIWADILSIVLPAGIFAWYMLVQRKASREYW
ncbi:MAG: hypothetical protein CW335_03495 [Clostridiales bacterium]|nr:hypothetical protein [Clostridiales bacterium]